MTKINIAILLTFLFIKVQAQIPSPGPKQTKSIFMTGATIHVGNGKVLENAAIGFKEGKITFLLDGADLAKIKLNGQAFDTVMDMTGKHIYPGFIAPNSTLGLNEIESVRATNDFAEVGKFNPHIRTLIAYNAESKVSSTVRTNGVLYVQATPRGGVISGKSSVMSLDAWNWEDAVLLTDDGVHLNFPKTIEKHGWWAEPEPNSTSKTFDKELEDIKTFFNDANFYCGNASNPEMNLRFEAMRDMFAGKSNLYIHADYVKDIISAVNFAKEFKIKNVVIIGGTDAWKVTKLLKENNIAVMVNRVHDLPKLEQDNVDQPFRLPYLLQKDSVLFCLQNEGDMEGMNARNLPFMAGTAVAYGLTKEQALASITSNAAKILHLENKIGTLEIGMMASLIVSDGDALDMRTNNIIYAFVEGRKMSLQNSQKDLYNKYMNKYNLPK